MNKPQFEKLVRLHKDAVYRQMIRVCAHKEDAEDALATALMLAFQAADSLNSEAAFRSWLGTIGKRVCTRMRSHAGIRQALDLATERHLIDPDVSEFDMEILKGCVKEAVDELPDLYRTVYLGCEIEGKSASAMAHDLGVSEPAVKSRLLRARAMVRTCLDDSICAG